MKNNSKATPPCGPIAPHRCTSVPLKVHSRSSTEGKGKVLPALTKPRRPLTAYNIFFRAQRAKIVGEEASEPKKSSKVAESNRKKRLHRKTHGKIGFMELAKVIGKEWKSLDKESRVEYETQAKEDLKRYRRETEIYRQTLHSLESSNQAASSLPASNKAFAFGSSARGNFPQFGDPSSLAPNTIACLAARGAGTVHSHPTAHHHAAPPSLRAMQHRDTLARALAICDNKGSWEARERTLQLQLQRETLGRALELCETPLEDRWTTTNNNGVLHPETIRYSGTLLDLEKELRLTLGDEMIHCLRNLQ